MHAIMFLGANTKQKRQKTFEQNSITLRQREHTIDGKDNKTCRATRINLEQTASRPFQWHIKSLLSTDVENFAQQGLYTAQKSRLIKPISNWSKENHENKEEMEHHLFYNKSHEPCKNYQLNELTNNPTLSNVCCTRIGWLQTTKYTQSRYKYNQLKKKKKR